MITQRLMAATDLMSLHHVAVPRVSTLGTVVLKLPSNDCRPRMQLDRQLLGASSTSVG
jgi:hypothetical protein